MLHLVKAQTLPSPKQVRPRRVLWLWEQPLAWVASGQLMAHCHWKSRLTTWHGYIRKYSFYLQLLVWRPPDGIYGLCNTMSRLWTMGLAVNVELPPYHPSRRCISSCSTTRLTQSGPSAWWRRSTRTTARSWPRTLTLLFYQWRWNARQILIRDCAASVEEPLWLHLFSIRNNRWLLFF